MCSRALRLICSISLIIVCHAHAAAAWQVCQPRTEGAGKECFVSRGGNDLNPGTLDQPFRTIAKGVSVLQAGDILNLRRGIYVEPVSVQGKHGTAANPIVIRSYPGEAAYIDGSVAAFRQGNNHDWEPASLYDPNAHPDEYVSVPLFADHIRGAFADRNPYTRLITYSRLEDLRASNETFEAITDPTDPRPGPPVVDCDANLENCVSAVRCDDNGDNCQPFRFPWVYMGPGIWIDKNFSAKNPQRVHIRLSHTHNGIRDLADYAGETDPRRLSLAISPEAMTTLNVQGSSHVRFERLTVRYGGDNTVRLPNSTDLVFDHVRFFSSTYGIGMGNVRRTTFSHCEVNGGVPTWYFRTDRKNEYTFMTSQGPVQNLLGKQTSRSLTVAGNTAADITIHHSEFSAAHDLYIGGTNVDFHHNWINNLNDEGLFLDATDSVNVRIHQNVIVRTLSPISFAGNRVAGPFYIYRNLVDVRAPTAGFRPRRPGDLDIWRYGNTFKSNGTDGPYALFQNTFLVFAQEGQASYLHYRGLGGGNLRRSFNNIFVAVNPAETFDRAIAFLPTPSFPGPTDGNLYFKKGVSGGHPLFRYLRYQLPGQPEIDGGSFATLAALYASAFFEQSKTQYAPGYEANSVEGDPLFLRFGSDGRYRDSDDLRLGALSPARNAGITLPSDLGALDAAIVPPAGAPDIGAFPYNGAALAVGVDGRRLYPRP
jgi:hypothetical protein